MRRRLVIHFLGVALMIVGGLTDRVYAEPASEQASLAVRATITEPPGTLDQLQTAISTKVRAAVAVVRNFFEDFGDGGHLREAKNSTDNRPVVKISAQSVSLTASEVQRLVMEPAQLTSAPEGRLEESQDTPKELAEALPSETQIILIPKTASIDVPAAPQSVAAATPPRVITILSRLASSTTPTSAPSSAPSPSRFSPSDHRMAAAAAGQMPQRTPMGPASAPARAPRPVGAPTPAPVSAPVASRDVLNYKKIEGPPSSGGASPSGGGVSSPMSSGTAASPSSSSVASAPTPASPTVASAPSATPSSASAAPVAASPSPPASVEQPVASRPTTTASAATMPTPTDVATSPAFRQATTTAPSATTSSTPPPTSDAPALNCGDIAQAIANRTSCRCPVRESGLGNLLPLDDGQRAENFAVAISNGKVMIAPQLFLKDALNCPADVTPSSRDGFELPRPQLRGAERDLLVVNVFGTPEGRLFGIAVDDADRRIIRGLGIWDVAASAAASTHNFKSFPEFLQVNQGVRGMMVTKDSGKTLIDITLIADDRSQVQYHCELGRDDTLTCTAPESTPTR